MLEYNNKNNTDIIRRVEKSMREEKLRFYEINMAEPRLLEKAKQVE